MKTLIKNGTVVDGLNNPAEFLDVLIENDSIIAVGKDIQIPVEEIIDASGLYVTPGFIDTHTHTDLANFIPEGMKPKIMQGITTEIAGQCGLGVAPVPREKQSTFRSRLIIGNPDIQWRWETFAEYMTALEHHGLESNIMPFIPHGVLRWVVKGDSSESLTADDKVQMAELARASFKAGAKGLSLGLIYHPALFSKEEELQVMMEVAAEFDRPVAVHLRSESDTIIEAIDEIAALARKTGCRIHLSHLKLMGERNAWKLDDLLKKVDEYGYSFDHYPYNYGSTTLFSVLPPFLFDERSYEEALEDITLPDVRETIKDWFSEKILPDPSLSWDNVPALTGWHNVTITSLQTKENEKYLGKTIEACAQKTGQDPVDFMLDLLIQERGQVMMINHYMDISLMETILQRPDGMIGSDALMTGIPHPRVYGAYPRILNQYVFGSQMLSLELAIHKMTGLAAKTFEIHDRGVIQEGKKADIVIFSDQITDHGTESHPDQFASGIHHLFINGQSKIKEGIYQPTRAGVVLKA
ncbi:N-acyl-D-amino-acid deacylase family protein [Parendozoicomonas haliclonae]|uniref:N-acyl-D-glutamate deacylase n=1 Tax=Parendozoicomonas haliclonae TaxID=1960125 RepID=A0A1X7ART6_9GAMM|nr:D-aminoacylase [Parendozoicomonas haliclonae]SMA50818.1 N-acyl-D-glutamate deacylase [Parendozoicomonas haliclonae]